MSGICRARNALCPAQLLSRLFRIPRSFSTACNPLLQDDRNRNVNPSSLQETLEAQRRANRGSLVHPVTVPNNLTKTFNYHPPLDYAVPLHPRRNKNRNNEAHPEKKGKKPMRKGPTKTRQNRGPPDREIPPPNYVGRYIDPLGDVPVADDNLPWFALSRVGSDNPMTKLNAEISAFSTYMQTTPQEDTARMAVVDQTTKAFQDRFPGLQLDLFGSQRSGLAFASSDVDLRIYAPEYENPQSNLPPRFQTRQALLGILHKATKHFRQNPKYKNCTLLHSRYPLLSMLHVSSGIDIQIVASNDTVVARGVMKKYMEEYPALRAIYTVVRQMLEVRGLTDVYFGGLGSYSIFMMVVASFKLHPRPENDSLAQHLIDFLTFYTKLDTNELWVSIEPPSLTKKIEAKPKQSIEEKQKLKDQLGIGKVNPNQPYLLSLRDPADKSNDLGRKCFCWKHVQTTMAVLREELLLRLEANDGTLLLTPLVGRNFKLLETKREHLQKFYSGRNMDNALRYLEGGFGTGSGNDSGESNMESAKDSEESNIESVRDVEESNVESAGEVEESHMESAGEFEESNLESAGELEGSNTGSAEGFKEPTLDSDKASEEPSEDKTEGSSST